MDEATAKARRDFAKREADARELMAAVQKCNTKCILSCRTALKKARKARPVAQEVLVERARILAEYESRARNLIASALKYNVKCILACHTALEKTRQARKLSLLCHQVTLYFRTWCIERNINRSIWRLEEQGPQSGHCGCAFDPEDPTFKTDEVHWARSLDFSY